MIIITKRKLEELERDWRGWVNFETRRAGIEAKRGAASAARAMGDELKAETLAKEDQLLKRIRDANKDISTLAEILKKHDEVGGVVEMLVEALRLKVEQLEEVIKNDRKTD